MKHDAYQFHREALEQALRLALGSSQPALRKQALEQAARHLIHPRLIIESPLLTDNHPWRREALAISDAFEAVTNGMQQPGVLDALDELPPDSLFQPWRHLILAVHFFYQGLDEAVGAHLASIPAHSPVKALARTLSSLTSGHGSPNQGRYLQEIVEPDPLLVQWVQDVAEGLETDQEDLFWSALTEWLEAVAPRMPARAQSAVLWAWNQMEWRDFDEAVLLDLGASLWGRTQSYRLAALGTLPWDPEGAALLWLRFLISAAREDSLTLAQFKEARALLDQFQQAALEAEASPEWDETWDGLSRSWNGEVMARNWPELALGIKAPLPQPGATGVQLDLFSL